MWSEFKNLNKKKLHHSQTSPSGSERQGEHQCNGDDNVLMAFSYVLLLPRTLYFRDILSFMSLSPPYSDKISSCLSLRMEQQNMWNMTRMRRLWLNCQASYVFVIISGQTLFLTTKSNSLLCH